MKLWLTLWYGVVKNNPIFKLVLGLCPTLAVTTSLENALGMGLAATFVLVSSNALVSLLRKVIPDAVHIPCYIVIIATFVTAIDLLMQAYLPELSASLGIFIPLIVVNCIILGRAEAYASKNPVLYSILDGVGSGIGFTLALAVISVVREVVGAGTLTVWGELAFKNITAGRRVYLARHHSRDDQSHRGVERHPSRSACSAAGQSRLPPLHDVSGG